MRLRVGVVLCLFATILGVGCREALAPNIDNNRPPETWITAAPFDTITVVDGTAPDINRIPVRFHVYWAGSDYDGAVSGFYWAVVETLPVPPDDQSPKPPDEDWRARMRAIISWARSRTSSGSVNPKSSAYRMATSRLESCSEQP